jgi:predicted nucleic acid-binding protein
MAKPYRIYMDVCCLNRPFDDWGQPRIRLEAEAVVAILEHCQTGDWLLVGSTALKSEIAQTPDTTRRQQVMDLVAAAKIDMKVTSETIQRAGDLQEFGFKPFDALHIACAEAAHVDVFVTTDDRLLRRANSHTNQLNVQVRNPLTWLMATTTDLEGESK